MNETVTRSEHLALCKARAMEYVDAGDPAGAFQSMVSDLQKHVETRDHVGIEIGMMMTMAGQLNSPHAMRRFIDGFN
jgi:hypothetical protein